MPKSGSDKHSIKKSQIKDHKQLGIELDLFTFSELVGGGLPLWTPRGTLLRDLLDDYVWELRNKEKKYKYERVDIPHLARKELYEKSGHWEKFQDDLFRITTREKRLFVIKPMNCPHHIQIFLRKKWSFRELPQRYASTTKIYRDEQSGELSGLARVRSITQDDAHVFCNMAATEDEIKHIWEVIHNFYGTFDLSLKLRLSLRDSKKPKQYLGDKAIWDHAEAILLKVAKDKGAKSIKAEGEAAFYGPKLDFMAIDSLGREWQVATIQLDLNMPKRFNLTFTNDRGSQSEVYMIHAAIMGSIERFMAILLEHFAGAFPAWLSPVQVQVIAVSQKHQSYAKKIAATIAKEDIRVELTDSDETLGKRIREGELQKIPYLLIVGDKEVKASSVAIRKRGKGDIGTQKLARFIGAIKKEITDKR